MAVKEEGTILIHTENIFPIIKKAVYSDHEIFLRELVSNSVDAIKKRKMAAFAGDCIAGEEEKIKISIDRDKKTLTIRDNGIGMTSEEIKKYINQVAFSSAEEFLEKYKQPNDGFIGHFGLGFYSSFMVADEVEIITKSARTDSQSIKWKCNGSPQYTLDEYEKDEIGTDIILHLMDEEIEYIEPSRIKTLIKKYCDFMPIEISLEDEVINKMNPPWRENKQSLKDEDYVELYKYLYPFQGEPLLWVHLNTDYPYNLQGILYFPKISGRADWENGEIKLFCNQVFVSDSIKEIVPRYLLPLRGVIDSPDIPLNVSRSALQSDRRVKSIGNFIAKKLADKLKTLKRDELQFYADIWESIAPFIKIGAMEDEKFSDQVKDIILYSTTKSASDSDKDENSNGIIKSGSKNFTTLESYKNRIKDEKKKILYSTDEVSQATALCMWTSQGKEVLKLDTVIDTQFIPWLEDKNKEINFVRVDSELDENIKDDSPEIADKDGNTKSETLKNIISSALKNDKVTIQVQNLKGDNAPPSLILLPEQMRRINDITALMEQKLPGLPEYHNLIVNLNHPLVQGLLKLNSTQIIVDDSNKTDDIQLANEIAIHIYEMAKLSIGGLENKEITMFQSRNADVLGKLMQKFV
tara:strand:+ start:4949 stop:6859 length:1911 start_codon:yes stop_codon:yes gene_type:complete